MRTSILGVVLLVGFGAPASGVPLPNDAPTTWSTGAPVTPQAQPTTSGECNAPSAKPIDSVVVPGRPFRVAVTADGCWLFVSTASPNPRQSGGIAVFERRGNANISFRRLAPVADGVSGLVITHDGTLLIGAADEYVVFFDVSSLKSGRGDALLGYVSDGGGAGSVYVNVTPDDRTLFVSDESQNTITVIDLAKARSSGFQNNAIVGKIPVGGAPIALTFSPDAKLLYTTSQAGLRSWHWPDRCDPEVDNPVRAPARVAEGAVLVVDVEKARTAPDKAVIARVPAGCSPVRLALDPTGESAWVTVRSDNRVVGFATRSLLNDPDKARVATVEVGKAPVGITVLDGGRLLAVTNSDRFSGQPGASQTFALIDTQKVGSASSAVVASLAAGAFPREFTQSPDGKTLFLTNFRSGTVQVIDVAHLSSTAARQQ